MFTFSADAKGGDRAARLEDGGEDYRTVLSPGASSLPQLHMDHRHPPGGLEAADQSSMNSPPHKFHKLIVYM